MRNLDQNLILEKYWHDWVYEPQMFMGFSSYLILANFWICHWQILGVFLFLKAKWVRASDTFVLHCYVFIYLWPRLEERMIALEAMLMCCIFTQFPQSFIQEQLHMEQEGKKKCLKEKKSAWPEFDLDFSWIFFAVCLQLPPSYLLISAPYGVYVFKCSRVPPVPKWHYAEAAGKTGGGSSVG